MMIINWNKWAVIVSGLALIISVAMPIIAYLWLDPKLQELRHSPKLKVTGTHSIFYLRDSEAETIVADRWFGVQILNEGRLPATDIKVVFHSDRPVENLETTVITYPPCPYKIDKTGHSVVISLERAIGNGQRVGVKLLGIVNDIETWVYSSQGAERISSRISSASIRAV
jgi:hypothetical protein